MLNTLQSSPERSRDHTINIAQCRSIRPNRLWQMISSSQYSTHNPWPVSKKSLGPKMGAMGPRFPSFPGHKIMGKWGPLLIPRYDLLRTHMRVFYSHISAYFYPTKVEKSQLLSFSPNPNWRMHLLTGIRHVKCYIGAISDWAQSSLKTSVTHAWALWKQNFIDVMQECIPRVRLTKQWNLPWLSKDFKRTMHKHNQQFRWTQQTGSTRLWTLYA